MARSAPTPERVEGKRRGPAQDELDQRGRLGAVDGEHDLTERAAILRRPRRVPEPIGRLERVRQDAEDDDGPERGQPQRPRPPREDRTADGAPPEERLTDPPRLVFLVMPSSPPRSGPPRRGSPRSHSGRSARHLCCTSRRPRANSARHCRSAHPARMTQRRGAPEPARPPLRRVLDVDAAEPLVDRSRERLGADVVETGPARLDEQVVAARVDVGNQAELPELDAGRGLGRSDGGPHVIQVELLAGDARHVAALSDEGHEGRPAVEPADLHDVVEVVAIQAVRAGEDDAVAAAHLELVREQDRRSGVVHRLLGDELVEARLDGQDARGRPVGQGERHPPLARHEPEVPPRHGAVVLGAAAPRGVRRARRASSR